MSFNSGIVSPSDAGLRDEDQIVLGKRCVICVVFVPEDPHEIELAVAELIVPDGS